MTIPHHPEGPQPSDHSRTVTFDLMADDDTYFVLTAALRDFASRQRWEAEDDATGNAQSRIRWAECAENTLDRIEQAMNRVPDAEPPAAWPDGDPRDDSYVGGYRPGLEED